MTNHAPALTRRSVLGAAVAVPAVGVLGPSPAIGHRGGHGGGMLPVRGGDLSFTLQLEQAGVRWSHRGRDAPVERIFAEAGATWTRLRVWVDPPPGYSTLESAIVLTRRANRAGMRVLLDLHYSDFWADPAPEKPGPSEAAPQHHPGHFKSADSGRPINLPGPNTRAPQIMLVIWA